MRELLCGFCTAAEPEYRSDDEGRGNALPQFDITLAGEANLDLLLYGLPEDIPVEREWIANHMVMCLGGSPAITAHNLAALGNRVGFITPVADDAFAQLCLETLKEVGVDLSRSVRVNGELRTGVSILLQHQRSRHMLTYPGATTSLRYEDLDLDYLRSARHFHLSSYFLQRGLRDDAGALLAACKEAGLTTSLDTNDDPSGEWDPAVLELLRYVDIFMPNEREACELTRETDPDAAIRKLQKQVSVLVVKRGRSGAVACYGEETCGGESIPLEFVDAVGAGDSFNAGFLHGFIHGRTIEECLRLGNLAGSYSTTALGGVEAFRDRDRWTAFLDAHSEAACEEPSTGHLLRASK